MKLQGNPNVFFQTHKSFDKENLKKSRRLRKTNNNDLLQLERKLEKINIGQLEQILNEAKLFYKQVNNDPLVKNSPLAKAVNVIFNVSIKRGLI